MAQVTENSTELPDGTTFLEFCNRCCERCRIVRWLGEDNPPKAPDWGGYHEHSVSERYPLSASCPLCQQLSHFVPVDFEDVNITLWLQTHDGLNVDEFEYRSDDKGPYDILCVHIEDIMNSRRRDIMDFRRRDTFLNFALVDMPGGQQYEVKAGSIEPFVNWKAVRKWIGHCEANHGLCARLSEKIPVPGLKIIDCETRAVVPFLDNTAPYVALSYVWGESQDAQEGYPQTVLDSMEAVLDLGLRYLWVDRACIDQKDSIHKATQIRMMDQIYFRAYLTIISCSDDADQGLPGMRKLPRDSQRSLWLGDHMLKQIYKPEHSALNSRWATRGWAFQEGCMSRRKLFFTGHGVALWCGSMYYEEGVSRSLPDIDEVREDLVPWRMANMAPTSLSAHRLDNVIWEYTMRDITYEDDTLNACLGVLNHLGYKHLWGIGIQEQPFSLELCWVRRACKGGPEQEAFPSWSWTRWRGASELYSQDYPSSIALIKTYLPSREEFDILRDTRYKGNLGAICSGKMLRITGTFLAPHFLVVKDYDEKNDGVICYCTLSYACGADIRLSVRLDMGMGSITSTIAYLDGTELLEITPLQRDEEGFVIGQLLLVKRHMDAYRRIGLGTCHKSFWIKHVCGKLECSEEGIIPMKGSYTKTINLI